MTSQKILSKLFWPKNCPLDVSSYLIGWNLRSFIGCVATVIPKNQISRSELETLLQNVSQDSLLKEEGPGPLILLGEYLSNNETSELTSMKIDETSIWFVLDKDSETSFPALREIWCYGYRYYTSFHLIFFSPPTDHLFLSYEPLKLYSKSTPTPPPQTKAQKDAPATPKTAILKQVNPGVPSPSELQEILIQINYSADVENCLFEAIKERNNPKSKQNLSNSGQNVNTNSNSNSNRSSTNSTPNSSSTNTTPQDSPRFETQKKHEQMNEQNVNNANVNTNANNTSSNSEETNFLRKQVKLDERTTILLSLVAQPIMKKILSYLNLFLLSLASLLELSVPFVGKFKDTTATGQQLAHRLEEISHWRDLSFLKQVGKKNPKLRVEYVKFYNSLWLVVNDVILGVIVAAFFLTFAKDIFLGAKQLNELLNQALLHQNIKWFMGWPAGFKLNDNLDHFLGIVFLFYVDKWTMLTDFFFTLAPIVALLMILLSSFGGLSFLFAFALDVLTFLTLHVTLFHSAAARIFFLQLNVLSSLWKLFRGMKYNPLRDRIDSCDYDIDQLLMGTILFTLIFFLLPTTAMYYLLFWSARSLLNLFKATCLLAIQLLNNFPLFPLVLFLTNTNFLPGGVWLELLNVTVKQPQITKKQYGTYFTLRNRSIPFFNILPTHLISIVQEDARKLFS